MFRQAARRQTGFTIIELLIVVAIIALLLALLLPALARARAVAAGGQCLSNLYQISIASSLYQDEHQDEMPIGKPTRGVSNYNHGGRYPVKASRIGRMFTRRPFDRPLNAYVHSNLPLGRSANLSDLENYRKFNFPAFNCPADDGFNYQENWSRRTLKYGLSAYHAVGSSYYFNLAWYGTSDWAYTNVADGFGWGEGIRYFRRAHLVYPSRFVAFYDDPADFHIARAESPSLNHHRVRDQHSMAFLDAHAAFVKFDPAEPVNGKYAVLFPEQMK